MNPSTLIHEALMNCSRGPHPRVGGGVGGGVGVGKRHPSIRLTARAWAVMDGRYALDAGGGLWL